MPCTALAVMEMIESTAVRLPGSRCSGRVVLSWEDGESITGTAEGVNSQTGVLRCAAEATARALELAVGETISLQLLGVRTIKAFDAILVVVSLQSRVSDHEQRVIGTAVIDSHQASRAAVNAVLSATNRLGIDWFATSKSKSSP